MATAFKLGGEVLVHDGTGSVLVNETSRHHQHVGIVVLTDEMGYLRNPAQTGTDGLVLVERHVDALAAAADGDAGEHFTLFNAAGQSVAEVTVVTRVLGIGAVVLIGIALLVEVLLHELL